MTKDKNSKRDELAQEWCYRELDRITGDRGGQQYHKGFRRGYDEGLKAGREREERLVFALLAYAKCESFNGVLIDEMYRQIAIEAIKEWEATK